MPPGDQAAKAAGSGLTSFDADCGAGAPGSPAARPEPGDGRNIPVTCDVRNWQYLTPMTHTIDWVLFLLIRRLSVLKRATVTVWERHSGHGRWIRMRIEHRSAWRRYVPRSRSARLAVPVAIAIVVGLVLGIRMVSNGGSLNLAAGVGACPTASTTAAAAAPSTSAAAAPAAPATSASASPSPPPTAAG